MQIVIDIPDRIYYGAKNGITVNGSDASQILIDAVKGGMSIPENPTNGDVIKAMFPDAEIRFTVNLSDMHAVHVKFGDNTYICYDNHLFSREWWNAPYRAESEDKE